jgi:hypothetical protein
VQTLNYSILFIVQIKEGPCNMYCDGIYLHHIHCDIGEETWKGDFDVDAFYCWNPPPPNS